MSPRGVPGSGPHARKKPEAVTQTVAPETTVEARVEAPADLTDEQKKVRLAALMEEMDKLVPAHNPTYEATPPGTTLEPKTVSQRKKPWTKDDLKRFPVKTFIPPFSTKIIWNGLRIDVEAGVEIDLPEPHYGVLMDSMRRNRLNNWYFGPLRPDEPKPPVGGMTRAHFLDVGAAAGLGRGDAVNG